MGRGGMVRGGIAGRGGGIMQDGGEADNEAPKQNTFNEAPGAANEQQNAPAFAGRGRGVNFGRGGGMMRGGIGGGQGNEAPQQNAFNEASSAANEQQNAPAFTGRGRGVNFGRGGGIMRGGLDGGQGNEAPQQNAFNEASGAANEQQNAPAFTGRGRGVNFGRGGGMMRGGIGGGQGNEAPQQNAFNEASSAANEQQNAPAFTGRGRGVSFGRGGGMMRGGLDGGQGNDAPQQNAFNEASGAANEQQNAPAFAGRGRGSNFGRGGGMMRGGIGGGQGNEAPQQHAFNEASGAANEQQNAPAFNGRGRDGGMRREMDGGQEGGNENRPPPNTYAPTVREIDEICKEDLDHADEYKIIADEDEEITVTGENISHVCTLASWNDAKFQPKLYYNIVERAKYIRPRKIQSSSIPIIMEGRDIKGHAETGSGKTAAFMLPIINEIMKTDKSGNSAFGKPSPYAIVIEPTRELCLQVYEQSYKFAYETEVSVAKAYGQYSVFKNLNELRQGCDVLCATPGRLKDFIKNEKIGLDKLRYFVLDEADCLLENNFLDDVREFATFPPAIQRLSAEILKPDFVMVSNKKLVATNSRVEQRFISVTSDNKKNALLELFQNQLAEAKKNNPQKVGVPRTIVFVRTKRDADVICLWLCGKDIPATTINGDRPQPLREKALRDLRTNEVSVLVCTDVCARGLDIKDLDHVINFDLPSDDVTYVHRIGRTGRLKRGIATSFVDECDNNDTLLAKNLVEFMKGVGQEVPEFLSALAGDEVAQPKNGASGNTNANDGYDANEGWC
ncbi:DEAD/DEAH box helicase domain-containing protein [Ditylenchus destructor]|uniref:RNA helicase n=1 Tax=Ditylenchus destructor TaxID=166010 RepID=A0AAD4N2Y6_9BILA|nr:DEAD/DEAH box helicase domain-containing protein [Ditylenchus destructor]